MQTYDNTNNKRYSRIVAFALCLMVCFSTLIPIVHAEEEIGNVNDYIDFNEYEFGELPDSHNHREVIVYKNDGNWYYITTKYTYGLKVADATLLDSGKYQITIEQTYGSVNPYWQTYRWDSTNSYWAACDTPSNTYTQVTLQIDDTESIAYVKSPLTCGDVQIFPVVKVPLFTQLLECIRLLIAAIVGIFTIVATFIWNEPLALISTILFLVTIMIVLSRKFIKRR